MEKKNCRWHILNTYSRGYPSHCQFDGTKEDRNCKDCPEFESLEENEDQNVPNENIGNFPW